MKTPFTRNAHHSGPAYIVRFHDYTGWNEEVHYFASSAMFRFNQLVCYPGVTDVSWRTQSGTVFSEAKRTERSHA